MNAERVGELLHHALASVLSKKKSIYEYLHTARNSPGLISKIELLKMPVPSAFTIPLSFSSLNSQCAMLKASGD